MKNASFLFFLKSTIFVVCFMCSTLAGHGASQRATLGGERKEIHILSTNDMHASIDAFPQLTAIVDSLRAIDPSLLVLSAGDNRTGNPMNDMYQIPAYPMVALMNFIGFNASALGNHEFDSKQHGLARLIGLSNFPYLCANIHPAEKFAIHTQPYQVYFVNGVRIAVLGVVQLGTHGIPDSHPNNVADIDFTPVSETIKNYEWLRKENDVMILLSHLGFETDVEMSASFPWIDLIVGGHSHTQLKGGEIHNGVLITQNGKGLKKVTYTTLIVEDGKVVEKKSENIDVANFPHKNAVVEAMVKNFNQNDTFMRTLAQVQTPFECVEELGCLMCDAIREQTQADIAFTNAGGVRYDTHATGAFTLNDVLRLDPFGNSIVEMKLTGKEVEDMLVSCFDNDEKLFPYVSGILCEIDYEKGNADKVKNLRIFTPDGKKLNRKKTYTLVTNSYAAAICDAPRKVQGHDLGIIASDALISYLEKQGTVSYQGVKRLKENK